MFERILLSRLCGITGCYVLPRNRLRLYAPICRGLCSETPTSFSKKPKKVLEGERNDMSGTIGGYKAFRDQDAPIIFDVEEEKLLKQEQIASRDEEDEFACLSKERGPRGVFSAEELIRILHKQKAKNIVVVAVPDSLKYVDEMIIVSGKSQKHIFAIAEFVHRAFKRKCSPSDIIPKVEGSKSSEWIALDLGNIALHVFSIDARRTYDLETLWAVGPEYDPQLNQLRVFPEAVKNGFMNLDDLQPASVKIN